MSKNDNEKKKIIGELLLKDEDVLAQLQTLVKLAKPFLMIEEKNGRVVLSNNYQFTNQEKVFLFLLGKYFAQNAGILPCGSIKLNEISDGLGIINTTLSKPIGQCVQQSIIDKAQKDEYQVNPHKIEQTLKELTEEYLKK